MPGLTHDEEQSFRTHNGGAVEGMLTVSSAVPGGPGASFLEPGDILLRINGEAVTVFSELEGVLDSNVGKWMSFEVMRGGVLIKQEVEVQDLHEITPKSYVEVGNCVLNDLSYHNAKHNHLPVGGVYVAKAGYILKRAGIAAGTMISKVNGTPVSNIRELCAVLAKVPDGQQASCV